MRSSHAFVVCGVPSCAAPVAPATLRNRLDSTCLEGAHPPMPLCCCAMFRNLSLPLFRCGRARRLQVLKPEALQQGSLVGLHGRGCQPPPTEAEFRWCGFPGFPDSAGDLSVTVRVVRGECGPNLWLPRCKTRAAVEAGPRM